ncbi:amidohydrolase family protein [Ostertagia ostertagi]
MTTTSYRGKTILPRYVCINGNLEENVPIAIDDDGVITEIGGLLPYDVIRLEHEISIKAFLIPTVESKKYLMSVSFSIEFTIEGNSRKWALSGINGMPNQAHSARAVTFDNIRKLYEFAVERKLAFHIHLEEQPKEIEDCMRFLGEKKGPSDVLLENLEIGALFSAVHATYTPPITVTEEVHTAWRERSRYLGDGIPHVIDNQHISFGTDCNNRISFLEEMRWACYSQQAVCRSRLLHHATMGGARSLSIDNITGSIEIGKQLDFVSFNLNSPVLAGLNSDTLVDGIIFSCGNREISRVVVAGSHSVFQMTNLLTVVRRSCSYACIQWRLSLCHSFTLFCSMSILI